MRKHSQKLSVFMLIALLIVVLAVCLAACDPAKDPQGPNTPTPEEHTTHTPDSTTDWHSDDTEHWHLCVEGGEPLEKAQHDFELKNDDEHHYLECKVCHKIKDTEGHITVVKSDENGHWVECTKEGCTYATTPSEHTYPAKAVADSDGKTHTFTCTFEGCGHTEQEGHELSYEHIAEGGHHQVCADCDYAGEKEDCQKAEEADYTDLEDGENHSFVCEKCEETVTEAHDLGDWESDGVNHYKVCNDCDAIVQQGACASTSETFQTNVDEHFKVCDTCGETISSTRARHSFTWQQNEEKTQHFEGCVCGYKKNEGTHDVDAECVSIDDSTHGKLCKTCDLNFDIESHSFEGGSADCVDCGYDDGTWKFEFVDEKQEAYRLIGSDASKLVEEQNITLPALYKGKQVTHMRGSTTASYYDVFKGLGETAIKTLVIPEGYTTLERYAIYRALDDLYLPASLTTIESNAIDQGYTAHADAFKLNRVKQRIHVKSVNDWFEIDCSSSPFGYALGSSSQYFDRAPMTQLYVDETPVTELTLPANFDPTNKRALYMLRGVTKLTFEGTAPMSNLSSAFELPELTDVYFKTQSDLLSIKIQKPFVDCNKHNGVNVYIGQELLKEFTLTDDMIDTEVVGVPRFLLLAGVGSIETFKNNCTQRISLDNFNYCTGLQTAYLGKDVSNVPTFAGCTSLKTIYMPDKIQNAFSNFVAGSTANIVFSKTAEVTSIYSLADSAENAWTGEYIIIPASVKTINANAFKYATNLKKVYFAGEEEAWNTLTASADTNGNDALVKAQLFLYHETDPGKGQNAYTWAYDENGDVKEYNPEPDCEHSFNWQHDDTSHWGQCSKCQWQTNKIAHSGTNYGGDDTSHWFVCEGCGQPYATATHTPDGDYHVDEQGHYRLCSVCNLKGEASQAHVEGNYQSDGAQHWHVCNICGEKTDEPQAHKAKEEYGHDETSHWQVCEICELQIGEKAAHSSGEQCTDPNEQGHWTTCTVCGQQARAPHVWGEDGDYKTGICTKCEYSAFTLDAQGKISGFTATDIERLSIPAKIGETDVTGIAKGSVSTPTFPAAANLKAVKTPNSEKFVEIGGSAFAKQATLEEFIISDSVTTLGTGVLSSCTALQTVIIGKGITTAPASSALNFSGKNLKKVVFRGKLEGVSSSLVSSATSTTAVWYFNNTVEEVNALIAKVGSSYLNKAKEIVMLAYSATAPDPATLGDYVDGAWYEEDGEMKIHGDMLRYATTTFDLNLSTLENLQYTVAPVVYTGTVTYECPDGVSMANDIVTFTRPGTFVITAKAGKAEVQLTFTVWSSVHYLEGTVGGEQIGEKTADLTFKQITAKKLFQLVTNLNENDSFKVNFSGGILKNVTLDDTTGAFTLAEDGTLSVKTAGKYLLSITYAADFSVTIKAETNLITVAIEGREKHAGAGVIVSTAVAQPKEGTITVALTLTYANLNAKKSLVSDILSYTNICFSVTLADGTKLLYDGSQSDPIDLSGSKYSNKTTASKWSDTAEDECKLWYQGTVGSSNSFTFTFTINSEGKITACVIS